VSFSSNRIRLALELTRPNVPEDQLDSFTSAAPRAPFGRDWGIEVGLFNKGALLASLQTDFQSLAFELKATTAAGVIDSDSAAIFTVVVSAVSFNSDLTDDQWQNDQGDPSYHAIFTLTDVQTGALDMNGAVNNVKVFGWVITAINSTGRRVTVGSGLLNVIKDGGTGAGAGVAPVASYTFSDQELAAMIAAKLNAGENDAGVDFTLRDRGGSGWGLRVFVEMEDGRPVLRQVEVPPIV
jgi:hypothetical protein